MIIARFNYDGVMGFASKHLYLPSVFEIAPS